MDGMAKRERTAAGDELSEEFGGVGSARLNRVAAGKEAVYVPASETEGMSAASNGGMQSGGTRRDRNPASERRDIGNVARDVGCLSLFEERTAVRRAVALFDTERALWVAWRIELQRVCASSGEPGPLDRLERNSAAEESSIGGQQQPVSDRTEREGEMLGVLGAGARGEALGAGLGASLRLSTGIDGDLRGARPLCRDMLSGGELDVGGRQHGTGTTGRWSQHQGCLYASVGGTLAAEFVPGSRWQDTSAEGGGAAGATRLD